MPNFCDYIFLTFYVCILWFYWYSTAFWPFTFFFILVKEVDNSFEENNEYSLEFCKHNISPLEEVENHWAKCFPKRKALLQQGMLVPEYVQIFPLLKQPQGYSFLLQDFCKSFPGHSDNLYRNWNKFRMAVSSLLKEENITSKFEDLGKCIFRCVCIILF